MHIRHLVTARHGYSVTSSTLLADPPSNETIDVFYIKTPMLIPYKQLFIQTYHKQGLLIQEQHMGDYNPLFQLITHTNTPHTHKH